MQACDPPKSASQAGRLTKKIWKPGLALFALLAIAPSMYSQKFYETEPINYYDSEAVDKIAAYFSDAENLEDWERSDSNGYLEPFLEAFDIPAASQTLVFSKTSLQASRIRPQNPRAIYFNEEIYVGWVPGTKVLEISAPSPETGTNFYTVEMNSVPPKLIRETHNCLQCHGGSFTRDVPGHLVRSVYPDLSGQPIFKAGTRVVDQTTPLSERWGGWLVSDTEAAHKGNALYRETSDGAAFNSYFSSADVPSRGYPSLGSDIVSHLILNHQAQLHTLLADLTIATRRAFHDQHVMDALLKREEPISDSTKRRIKHASDKVLKYMFFADEADLPKVDLSQSEMAAEFQERGPKDSKGRSLYQLRMNRRMFRYPFSYIVYTDTFNDLPREALDYLWPEIERILDPATRPEGYSHISRRDKIAIKEILLETHPSAKRYWK